MMSIKKYSVFLLLLTWSAFLMRGEDNVKTTMQTGREWRPTIDTRCDAVMVYGIGGNPSDRDSNTSFEGRIKSWKDKGYKIHFMTGIAWGEYKDYFTGQWDGKWHLDEGQVQQNGDTIWHGHLIPYIVPSMNFIEYIKQNHIKRAIDAGAEAIFLEEPEFWARSGYSDAFKREWKEYYGSEWQPPHSSPEATYLSNKLKYYLYTRALDEVTKFAKEYGESLGKDILCYVPTHSLVNYSQWQIVSPEANLASLPGVDGYIAQVWTGTSREPNFYNGDYKERVFETALLEYGSMSSMTKPTGRKMFFLTDPIEDRAKDWDDYKRNYQATFTAQLMYPDVDSYEVMPWPERVYEGRYKVSADSDKRETIPEFYSTQMQVMINSLNKIPASDNKVSGSHGVGVLMANSLMFQRFPQHNGYDDPQLSNFYGLALPFIKRGVPLELVHIENLNYPKTLENIDVQAMTYSNMKPLDSEAHEILADWVKNGGNLIFCGSDLDAFQNIKEWWNTNGNEYSAPSQHLFEKLGIDPHPSNSEFQVGEGKVIVMRTDPKDFVINKDGDLEYFGNVNRLYSASTGNDLQTKNNFQLKRGPYRIISVLDETLDETPVKIEGRFIDLFNPKLPIVVCPELSSGTNAYFFDLSEIKDKSSPSVLAASFRESNENIGVKNYAFTAKSPIDTNGIARIYVPAPTLKKVTLDGDDITGSSYWDSQTQTLLMEFENNPDGRLVEIEW